MTEKIKLADGPEKTVTWIWLENGQLKVELYDFSETAHQIFGNDFVQIITVEDMQKVYSKMEKDETSILPWMEQYFKSYFGSNNGWKRMELSFVLREKAGLEQDFRSLKDFGSLKSYLL